VSDLCHSVHRPCALLSPYVREMLWIQSSHPRIQVLLPETTLTLMFRQTGSVSLHGSALSSAILSGLQPQARIAQHSSGSSMVIVRFTETGAAALLCDRVDLLYNQTLALDSVLPLRLRRQIDGLQTILAETPDPQQKISAVERFLVSSIDPRAAAPSQIVAAVQQIRASNGKVPIAAIARHAGMSQSALERHFSAAVGASPKGLARLARLQHVCRLWDAGLSLTTIAFEAGFTDQPHLSRDFRAFAGSSPAEFFRQGSPRNLPTFYK